MTGEKGATEESSTSSKRVFIVSYRFPSTLLKDGSGVKLQNACVAAGGNFLIQQGHEVVWVGHETLSTPGSEHAAEAHTIPVPMLPKSAWGWYEYCKVVLWPLFHYVGGHSLDVPDMWQNYVDANTAFADVIAENYKQGDFILIQDYHLLLLPSLLRKRIPQANVAFFLHTPWPSSEIYRALPVRDEVLNGILGANLVGFQTYSYLKHFNSACTRLLGLTANDKGIFTEEERLVRLDVYPAGIDAKRVSELMTSPELVAKVAEFRKTIQGKKMVVSNDRIEYTEGIPHKLKAWETFLTNYPEWQGKVMLTLCCEANSALLSEKTYQHLQEDIEQQVGAINGKFGTVTWTPVRYLNHKVDEQELYAIFASADVGLWTPLRAGMNLTCHNFVCAQQENHGVLIMSELAGSAQCLSGCVLVNPWDDKKVAKAVHEALTMKEDQRKIRFKHCFDYVTTHDAGFWMKSLLAELVHMDSQPHAHDYSACLPRANLEQLADVFAKSQKRLLLLDYDGTLSPLVSQPDQAGPTPQLLALIEKLASQENTYIYVISGRDRTSLGEWLGHLPIGMSCEHGLFFRPYLRGGVGEWQDIISTLDTNWKTDIRALFKDFTDRTPGSMIESKEVNLTWHYRNADPDFGEYQKNELLMHLQDLPGMPIDILPGKKAVEVRPQGINKGSVVRRILALHKDTDFAVCMGDDKTDEDMFVELDNSEFEHHYTIMVDKKPTSANFYVDEQSSVIDFLAVLAERN